MIATSSTSSGSWATEAAIPPTVVGPCPIPELRPFFEFHKKLTQSPKGFVDLTEDILGDKGRVEEKKNWWQGKLTLADAISLAPCLLVRRSEQVTCLSGSQLLIFKKDTTIFAHRVDRYIKCVLFHFFF